MPPIPYTDLVVGQQYVGKSRTNPGLGDTYTFLGLYPNGDTSCFGPAGRPCLRLRHSDGGIMSARLGFMSFYLPDIGQTSTSSRNIPKLNNMGLPTASALTLSNIQEGNDMVNFPRTADKTEYNFGEYYSNAAYKAIRFPKQNPQTRIPINSKSVKHYKAHLVPKTNMEKINTTLFNGGRSKRNSTKRERRRQLSRTYRR